MTRVFHPALSGPEQSRYQITDVASVSRSGLCINESPIRDRCGRTMGDLRLSVIDQCNLRCRYCMPEAEYAWLPRADLLSVDEISLIVDAFIAVGVDKIRLTGGEPLIRSDLAAIIEVISAKVGDGSGLQDLAITTNGVLLADQARKLKSAGMRRITISLDTLRPDRFKAISQRGTHYKVIEGIEAVAAAGFTDTKLDSVVIRGFNDDELSDLIEFARNVNAEVRFIEYMDVGGATQWSMDKVFTKAQMLSTLGKKYGPIAALPKYDSAPANRYRLPDGTTFGIIASTTEPFCATCDRSRLTADGIWLHCLEPPRHVRRLQFLERMGSCQVVHRGGTRRSCVSGRCGWSQRSAVSTIRSGQRSVRSPVYLVLAARRRCVSGCARRRSMPAHGPGPRPKNPLS